MQTVTKVYCADIQHTLEEGGVDYFFPQFELVPFHSDSNAKGSNFHIQSIPRLIMSVNFSHKGCFLDTLMKS